MFLLIDKPKGMTSHDVVNRVRKITGERRVGHAGTLDPNATGLLVVGVGRESTKLLSEISKNKNKTYEAEIFLGEERTTDDVEGEVTNKSDEKIKPEIDEISSVLKTFEGEQEQIPPIYSAIKLKGKKAYELARKGEAPEMEPRKVNIYSIKLLEYNYPILKIVCDVSSGTYIRSIARDIGRKLKTFGYLKELRRTNIGEFSVDKAQDLQQLQKSN